MKKLMGITYSNSAFNISLFILRVCAGLLMLISHGYVKLTTFNTLSPKFVNLFGMGSTISLGLSTFAEFFCSLFVVLGLFTRLACIPLLINMAVAITVVHKSDVLQTAEKASLFFLIFLTILILGPGKISVDGMIKK
jgi:putative oxidoreductase